MFLSRTFNPSGMVRMIENKLTNSCTSDFIPITNQKLKQFCFKATKVACTGDAENKTAVGRTSYSQRRKSLDFNKEGIEFRRNGMSKMIKKYTMSENVVGRDTDNGKLLGVMCLPHYFKISLSNGQTTKPSNLKQSDNNLTFNSWFLILGS